MVLLDVSERANKDSGKLHMLRECSYLSSNKSYLVKKKLECYLTEWWIRIITRHCGCSQTTAIPILSHWESFQVAPADGYFPPELHNNNKRGLNWLCPGILAFQQYKVWKRLGKDNKLARVQHVLPSFVWHMKKNNISHQEKNRRSKQLLNNKDSMCHLVCLVLLPSIDILERFESRES